MINSRSRKEHKIHSRLDSDCALFSEIDSWASLSDKTRPFPYFNHRFKHEAVNQRKQDPYDCDASFLWVTEGCNVKLLFCAVAKLWCTWFSSTVCDLQQVFCTCEAVTVGKNMQKRRGRKRQARNQRINGWCVCVSETEREKIIHIIIRLHLEEIKTCHPWRREWGTSLLSWQIVILLIWLVP